MLENKLDAKTSLTRSGRVSGNRGKKGKSSKATKLRFQGIRSKNVGLLSADVARKRGDVAVRNTFRDFVLPLTGFISIDGMHNSGIKNAFS